MNTISAFHLPDFPHSSSDYLRIISKTWDHLQMIFSDRFWYVLHWFSYTSYSQIRSSVEGTGLSRKVPSWNSHIYIRTTRIRDMNLVRVWFIFQRLVLVPFWQKFRCTQCNLYSDPNQFYFLTNPNIHFYFQKDPWTIFWVKLYKIKLRELIWNALKSMWKMILSCDSICIWNVPHFYATE